EDGDIGMGDSTGVSASLGGEIFSGGKKCCESNISDSDNTGDEGKIVGGAIGACGGKGKLRLMGASSKSCEYVLDTLMQVFEDKWFAHAVKERTLDNLITEILIWLLDERVPRMHDGSQLIK
ncbi:hypothetical protein Tco_1462698, partial [Tanacetum coccineum]